MTGLQTVLELRKARVKPSSVHVYLVDEIGQFDTEEYALDERATCVQVHITEADDIEAIDFRPLHGLMVFAIQTIGVENTRYRQLCKALAAVDPGVLIVSVAKPDGSHVVHIRHKGGTNVDRLDIPAPT